MNELNKVIAECEQQLENKTLDNDKIHQAFDNWCIFTRLDKALKSGLVTQQEVKLAISDQNELDKLDDTIDERLWERETEDQDEIVDLNTETIKDK